MTQKKENMNEEDISLDVTSTDENFNIEVEKSRSLIERYCEMNQKI